MPSPFPGMDPYVEDPVMWADVHHELISVARATLNRQILPKYVAAIDERVYLLDEDDPDHAYQRVPDLRVFEAPVPSAAPQTSIAVAEAMEPIKVVLLDDQVREPFLQILDAASKQVVTIIEVLSPWNKQKGSPGRKSFTAKRREVMNSPTHWVEIDLLRQGERVRSRPSLKRYDYIVHACRADDDRQSVVWPIRLRQRLPVITIPLRKGDADARLNLQDILHEVYDRGGYERRIDYKADPVPPLSGENAVWAREWLKGKGRG